jgi:heptosyltransferase-2
MNPRLLIVELWGLGDLMIASPFIRAATERYSVTVLAKPIAAEIGRRFWPSAELIPFTAPWTTFRRRDKYILWRWPWAELRGLTRTLRQKSFDAAVSARWDPRDHALMRLTGARARLGFPRLGSQSLLTRSLAVPKFPTHRSEYWRIAGSALGLAIPARAEMTVARPAAPPVIVIHTGAAQPRRVWPLKNFYEITTRLRQARYAVKIICDADQLDWWRQRDEEPTCPGSLSELVTALEQGAIFIGNDSGPGHVAALCGLPTFTIFGPQIPELFLPLHRDAEAFEGHACPHKPCWDYCRYPEPFCLWSISPDEVWPRVAAFVSRHLSANPPAIAASTKLP